MSALKTPFGDVGSLLEADLCREKIDAAYRDHKLTSVERAALRERIDDYCRSIEPLDETEALRRLDHLRGFHVP